MKRAFKYILYILLIIAIILVVAWLRARKSAQEAGRATPSFREFLGLSNQTKTQPGTTPGGELSSDFTDTNNPSSQSTGDTVGEDGGSGVVTSSQFTSGPLSPTQNNGNNQEGGGRNGGSSSSPNGPYELPGPGTGSGAPASGPGPSSGPRQPTPSTVTQCTDADLNIEFTADEIRRLNELQNRFYAISGILHTDADVENETANHDEFKAKVDQITELYNYCVAQSPKITAPAYTTRITTPYWRTPGRDGNGYVSGKPNGVEWIELDSQVWNPTHPMVSHGVLEQLFRINLW